MHVTIRDRISGRVCDKDKNFKHELFDPGMSILKGVEPIFTQGPAGISLPPGPPNPEAAMPNTFPYLQKAGNPMSQQRPQSERTTRPRPTKADLETVQTTPKAAARVSKSLISVAGPRRSAMTSRKK